MTTDNPASLTSVRLEDWRIEASDSFFKTMMGTVASFGDNGDGDYHEYGVFSAVHFRLALKYAHYFNLAPMKFHAFDSFEGLPDSDHLSMSEKDFLDLVHEQNILTDRVQTYPGYFEDTLTPELQRQFIEAGRRIAFVNIDCDHKAAATHVLNFIEPLLKPGSIVYLDDFYSAFVNGDMPICGQPWGTARAFFDHAPKSQWGFYPIENNGTWGRAFMAYDHKLPSGPMF
jgi:hypothetical protein